MCHVCDHATFNCMRVNSNKCAYMKRIEKRMLCEARDYVMVAVVYRHAFSREAPESGTRSGSLTDFSSLRR